MNRKFRSMAARVTSSKTLQPARDPNDFQGKTLQTEQRLQSVHLHARKTHMQPGPREGGRESVSAGVSPVVLVDCVSTGYITVAMASCPAAHSLTGREAHRGPALSGWHLLPHCPGTFARPCTRCAVHAQPQRGPCHGSAEVALRTALSPC